jgi:hypothetical protein
LDFKSAEDLSIAIAGLDQCPGILVVEDREFVGNCGV